MTKVHVLGLLQNEQTAEGLIRALKNEVQAECLSLIHRAEELHLENTDPHPVDSPVDGTLLGTGIGAALGLTFVTSNLAIVGVTATLAGFGPLAALIYGGMFGGLMGGITDITHNPPNVKEILEELHHGKLLVHAETDETHQDAVLQLFRDFSCEHITHLQTQ